MTTDSKATMLPVTQGRAGREMESYFSVVFVHDQVVVRPLGLDLPARAMQATGNSALDRCGDPTWCFTEPPLRRALPRSSDTPGHCGTAYQEQRRHNVKFDLENIAEYYGGGEIAPPPSTRWSSSALPPASQRAEPGRARHSAEQELLVSPDRAPPLSFPAAAPHAGPPIKIILRQDSKPYRGPATFMLTRVHPVLSAEQKVAFRRPEPKGYIMKVLTAHTRGRHRDATRRPLRRLRLHLLLRDRVRVDRLVRDISPDGLQDVVSSFSSDSNGV